MAGDIEDFLRRAAQRRGPQARQPAPAPAPAPVARPPQRPPVIQILGDDDVVEADVVDPYALEDPGILSGHDVGSHVSQHINTSDFGERASHLGEDVDNADERMESHMQDHFEHKLGELGASTSKASESTLDDDGAPQGSPNARKKRPPFNFRKLLRSSSSIRDAIVISEILRRPEDRW